MHWDIDMMKLGKRLDIFNDMPSQDLLFIISIFSKVEVSIELQNSIFI